MRATFNSAIKAKIVAKDKNPFTEYKLSHLNTKTMKRALSKSDIMKIMQADCTDKTPTRQLAQDLFAFSYLCGGISFVDIANLTPKNIIDNRLIYQRQKTHGEINLQLSDEAKRATLFTFGSPSCIYDSCRTWSLPYTPAVSSLY